jgi:16S rRNA (uracil1498-N3)-methyltransferase
MADRYFVETPIDGPQARLIGTEAHHLIHVMRGKIGDQITLFDGLGAEYACRVSQVGRSEVTLNVGSRQEVNRESSLPLTLAVALPKGDRRRWLVEKAVELGVARLIPLETERSNDRETSAASVRLQQTVIEASKQCGRNRLMEIGDSVRLADFVADAAEDEARLVAHPGGAKCHEVLGSLLQKGSTLRGVSLIVGPEGGLAPAELAAARAGGWRIVDLGNRVLRVETAALALAAAVMLHAPANS